jgi:hypothetical protein
MWDSDHGPKSEDHVAKIQEAIHDQVRYLHDTYVMSALPAFDSAIKFLGASILPPVVSTLLTSYS